MNAPIYLRLMRSQVLAIRQHALRRGRDRLPGCRICTIMRRHVIPNAMAPVLAQLSVNIGWAILLTAGSASSAPACGRRRPNGAA